MNEKRLGIVLVASPFDWLFAKGAIASCWRFAPGTPVTLIVDGDLDAGPAEAAYGVEVIRRRDIQHPELARHGFGWGLTKMLAFWHARQEEFLYLDSDVVLWGDPWRRMRPDDADFVVSLPKKEAGADPAVATWFFEPPFIERHFPDWDWRADAFEFFCTGVFAARKGIFDLDDYLSILELNRRHPGQFKFGEMGFLNLMVFRARSRGALKVRTEDFQVVFPEHPVKELEERFRFVEGEPVVSPGEERALHMPDKKPLVDSRDCYSLPMTHFRLEFLAETEGLRGGAALARLREEDADYHRLRAEFLKRSRRAKIHRLLTGHPGEWKRLGRKVGLFNQDP